MFTVRFYAPVIFVRKDEVYQKKCLRDRESDLETERQRDKETERQTERQREAENGCFLCF
jgi:hypothetical protein